MNYRHLRLITATLFLMPLVLAACKNKGDSVSGDGDGDGDASGDGDGAGDGDLPGDGDWGDGDGDSAGGNSGDGDASGGAPGDGDGDVPGNGGSPDTGGAGGASGGASGGAPDGSGGELSSGGSGSEAPPPDACPTEQMGTCATDCGESAGPCDTHYTCSGLVLYNGAWPPAVRIPSASELCESTEPACPWGSPTAVRFSEQSARIYIPEDWSALLVTYDESNDENLEDTCAAPKVEGCLAIPDTSESPVVLFFPKGPDSGARNLVIESSETPLECP